MMPCLSRFYAFSVCFFAFLMAPAAFAHANPVRLPYVGQKGQLPVEVAVQFLKKRLEGEAGQVDYQTLTLVQRSAQQEISDQVNITVMKDGLLDDSVQGNRWQLQLHLNSKGRWQINTVKEDFSCRRGRKGWAKTPCS